MRVPSAAGNGPHDGGRFVGGRFVRLLWRSPRGPAFASAVCVHFKCGRMRPLRISFVLAASAAQWACVDEARTETAAAHARDSALVHDLVLAGYDSAAVRPTGRYFGSPATGASTVTESQGALADAATGATPTPMATNVTAKAAPSAESYVGPSCASPTAADQQRCLSGYLARSDAQLDRSYQALITQLKAEAGTHSGASEPPTVQRLRTIQRNWVTYRDDECRRRTAASEGPLWAPVRAKCLAEYSTLRQHEIDDALAKRTPVAAKSAPEKARSRTTKQARRTTKTKRHSRR
jgi:uncharacterized protein YecT (DUF1311 family)